MRNMVTRTTRFTVTDAGKLRAASPSFTTGTTNTIDGLTAEQ